MRRTCFIIVFAAGCLLNGHAEMRLRSTIDHRQMVRSDAGIPLRGCRFMINSNMTNSNQALFGTDSVAHREYFHSLAADFHLNCIRIIFKAYRWGQSNEFDDEYLPAQTTSAIDAVVRYCEEEGIYAVLNYHEVGSLSLSQAKEFWGLYAPRYKDKTHVLYELCNEPKKWGDEFSDGLIEDIDSLYVFVDRLAPETFKICFTPSGLSNSTVTRMVEKASRIEYDHAAVGYHLYQGNVGDADAVAEAGYPVMCTEIPSDTDEKVDYGKLMPLLKDLEEAGQSWLSWFPDANGNETNQFGADFMDSLSAYGIDHWPADTARLEVRVRGFTASKYRHSESGSRGEYNVLGRFRKRAGNKQSDVQQRKLLEHWNVIVR